MPKENSKPSDGKPEAAIAADQVQVDPNPAQPVPDDAPGGEGLGGDHSESEQPEGGASEPEQSIEEACAELGIKPDADGNVEIELLVSLAGANVKNRGEKHPCDAAEAVRMVRAGFAKPL